MHHQKTYLQRQFLNNPRIYESSLNHIESCSLETLFSFRYNAKYDAQTLTGVLFHAMNHGNVSSSLEARRKALDSNIIPTGEWFRDKITRLDISSVLDFAKTSMTSQLKDLQNLGYDTNNLTLAVDMHLIPRYDKEHGEELTRSKPKKSTEFFERYITIQCVNKTKRLILGVLPVPRLYGASEFVPKIIQFCQNLGVRPGLILFDREFFSQAVMNYLNENKIRFLMPCVNHTSVVSAIRQCDLGYRDSISRAEITNGHKQTAQYVLFIVQRSAKRKGTNPEDRFIGFAASHHDIDVTQYKSRWGIETGYKNIESIRLKTRSKNSAARLFCFVYTALMYNSWVLANAELIRSGLYMTQKMFQEYAQMRYVVVLGFIPPQPPPECVIWP